MTKAPPIKAERVRKILANYPPHDGSALVNLLHDIQAVFRYLPRKALQMTARHVGLSPARVFEVATFYEGFHLKPRGEHICTVCMGTACHVRGSPRLLEQLERDLDIGAGQTTADLKFTLEEVNCVGACALGPLVIIDGKYNGNMTSARLTRLVGGIQKKGEK